MEPEPHNPPNPAFAEAKTRIDARVAELRRQVAEGPLPPRGSYLSALLHSAVSFIVAGSALYVPALIVVSLIGGPPLGRYAAVASHVVLALLWITTVIAAVGGFVLARRRKQARWLLAGIWGALFGSLQLWFFFNPMHLGC